MTESEPSLVSRLIVGIAGSELTEVEDRWLRTYRPGGVILFGRNVTGPAQLRVLCRSLHAALPQSAEIVADHEGGAISVLAAAVGRPPAPFGLGRLDTVELTQRVHARTGERLVAVGIDRVLAPCADVLYEAHNPVIGQRSFGTDARLVACHVAAAVRGLTASGLGCCVKHWPGHGATRGDSHLGPVTAAEQDDTPVFLAGLEAGCDAMLIGHLPLSTEIDALPATLDRAALIRARSLASGVRLYADDITMGALRPAPGAADADGFSAGLLPPAELPTVFFERVAAAGCDRLLCRGIPWRAFPLPSAVSLPCEAPGPVAADAVPARVWIEARQALAEFQKVLPRLDGSAHLLWLDTTREDRWGATDDALVLRADFASVRHCEPGWEVRRDVRTDMLLVTSHRPLDDAVKADLARALDGRQVGVAVVMGHPSLEASIASVVPSECDLRVLYDIRVADLRPLFEGVDEE